MPGRAIRRVVTGVSPEGKTVIASDTVLDPAGIAMMPGAGFTDIWGSDRSPTLPATGDKPAYRDWFPPSAGYRVQEITIPPASAHPPADLDMAAAAAEMEQKVPGLLGHMDPKHPGMHRTDTVDFVYVASGRCVLELEDGTKSELGPGDIVIQNGTRHAWRVPYDEPCTVLSISIGAPRKT
jgi:hypothetical protein